MSGLKTVEPGWLSRPGAEAMRSIQSRHAPQYLIALGHSVTLPIPADQAATLYADLNARFVAWTGKTLAQWDAQPKDTRP